MGATLFGIAFADIRYYRRLMTTISVKLPDPLARALQREAESRDLPKSVVVRESLEQALANSLEEDPGPSCYDLVADLVGTVDGPADASTNKAYLDEAILEDHRGEN